MTISVEVPDSLVEPLQALAAERGVSLSELLVGAASSELSHAETDRVRASWPKIYKTYESVFHRLAQ